MFAGKTKKGELSIFPKSMQLLSYCMHMLPKTRAVGGKNQVERSLEKSLDVLHISSVSGTDISVITMLQTSTDQIRAVLVLFVGLCSHFMKCTFKDILLIAFQLDLC